MTSLHSPYAAGIWMAYQGELVGDRLYRSLSTRSSSPDRQAKLMAIANVERLTHRRLRPIAQRLGITVSEADCGRVAERRSRELGAMPWSDFIDKAVNDWPPYIARFEALLPMAPPGDERSIQLLVDHEIALVEFARVERAELDSAASLRGGCATDASLRVLENFLCVRNLEFDEVPG